MSAPGANDVPGEASVLDPAAQCCVTSVELHRHVHVHTHTHTHTHMRAHRVDIYIEREVRGAHCDLHTVTSLPDTNVVIPFLFREDFIRAWNAF